MTTKTIMLACAAGMSTSLLVDKMKAVAKQQDFDVNIFAIPASEADDYIASQTIDVVLLGPQVRYMEKDFHKKLDDKGIPVSVIPMADYGMMNGANVVKLAQKLIKD